MATSRKQGLTIGSAFRNNTHQELVAISKERREMRSNRSHLAAISAVAIVVLGVAVPAAFADVVAGLDTGTAPWMVTRTEIGGETSPNTNEITVVGAPGNSQTYSAADVADPFYPHWIQASAVGDGDAQWVSWDASTGMGYEGDNENSAITNDATSYVYTDTFTLNGAANASLSVNAQLEHFTFTCSNTRNGVGSGWRRRV